ncbi:hypothetical protein EVAR_37580_1 [Eumeta japonica]|uniref:Uncharacterized protein n=1 Tax=Eumeta variegata TaxID=151549 RepID=A0A4C1VPT4_EUMVA|nr:hypothetical protein EVAR_37580_1 [Eumeta japonica]
MSYQTSGRALRAPNNDDKFCCVRFLIVHQRIDGRRRPWRLATPKESPPSSATTEYSKFHRPSWTKYLNLERKDLRFPDDAESALRTFIKYCRSNNSLCPGAAQRTSLSPISFSSILFSRVITDGAASMGSGY